MAKNPHLCSLCLQELEHEKLQVKLRNQLMERKREAKKAFDLAGQIQKRVQQQAGAGGGEGRRPSARADEETYRVRRRWAAEQEAGDASCPCSTSSA